MQNIIIKVLPFGIEWSADKGENLLELLRKKGFYLSSSCGGHGICGKCLVEIKTATQSEFQIKNACQVILNEDTIVDLSNSNISKITTKSNVVKKVYDFLGKYILNPQIKSKFLEVNRKSDSDYLSQIHAQIKVEKTSLNFLRKFSYSISNEKFSGWVIHNSTELLDWYPSDQTPKIVGCAIDIGTTNIAIEIVDLESGETLYQGFDINSQIKYGDDVISRISYASLSEENLQELKKSVFTTINDLINKGLKILDIPSEFIYDVVIAGNTTMTHLFLGVSPKSLGELPFSPIFASPIVFKNSELNLIANPSAQIYTFPAIGSFVGGDITAGLLALDLFNSNENFLFLDLGTNGEIAVGKKGEILTTSTATGPAFEGGRIACGMRADEGAIDHIFITEEDMSFTTIGDLPPKGICGTAIIELISILLDSNLLDISGKLLIGSTPNFIPLKISNRVVIKDDEPRIIIHSDKSSRREIYLSSRDIRQFQLACGAIKCGVNLLLKYAKISPEEIDKVYIAGNFGSYIHPKYLARVGIIPASISPDKIDIVGNTSLLGAKIALLDCEKRKLAEKYVKSIKHVELATLPDFEQEFVFSMYFPEIH